MEFIEVCKKDTKNINDGIEKGFYNIWNDERIKKAFNFGNGTIKDFNNYMNDNKKYCYFKQIS